MMMKVEAALNTTVD